MLAGPPPTNDIVFLFTDAEEACLCGAEAFVSQDPLAADGGVALNFESRGTTGPAIMFETSPGNAAVVDVYGAAVPYPVATSFAVEVYRILPNDTDFSPFRESGSVHRAEHRLHRRVGRLSHAAGQAGVHGPIAACNSTATTRWRLARAFGAADIASLAAPGRRVTPTYFPALGCAGPLSRMAGLAARGARPCWPLSRWASWPAAAACQLAAAGRRASGSAVVPLVLAPVAAQLLWPLLVALRPGYAQHDRPLVAGLVPGVRRRAGRGHPCSPGTGCCAAGSGRGRWPSAPSAGSPCSVWCWPRSPRRLVPGRAARAGRRAPGRVALTRASTVGAGWRRVGLAGAVAVLVLAPTVLLFFPALGLATGAAGRAVRRDARPGPAAR